MTFDQSHNGVRLSAIEEVRIDEICDRFEAAWKAEQRPCIQDHVGEWSGPKLSSLLNELVAIELAYRVKHGESPSREDYEPLFPQHIHVINRAFAEVETSMAGGRGSSTARRNGPAQAKCFSPKNFPPESSPSETCLPEADAAQKKSLSPATQPTQIGRYKVLEMLGEGGFGTVYLGFDDTLKRRVAVKVPRSDRVGEPASFLKEARILASLDHPNIVNVYDYGQTSDGYCYFVSKWTQGTDLAEVLKRQPLPFRRSAELVAKIADALRHAHLGKLVHRDVKPANILIDSTGEPYLTDFGLALSEEAFGREHTTVGTAAYMSPEQARGEGHLVDGRSDIFSLGVVFYELLAGERPFVGSTRSEVLHHIGNTAARPPRQLTGNVPKELERICLKALSKRANDRYTTALDMAEDLRHWSAAHEWQRSAPQTASVSASRIEPSPVKIVPKGLRSFDINDADFFLELLPGPRDRNGLPEAIRFWNTRIEEMDADNTFRVGLIYGPSGCGKSSLVKAGLLPRLPDHVISVYVEAAAKDTEKRLLKELRKRIPNLPPGAGLSAALAAMRRGQVLPPTQKVLIVVDQFEQWLHAGSDQRRADLTQALRHCDGARVQCLILVRDDFWLAVSRFIAQLEIDLAQGRNVALVDLFDELHARKVLAEFGRSFGCLPNDLSGLTDDQKSFLDEAVGGLAQDGKVVSVHLSLFAEMVKGRPWTPATLRQLGGMEGVGTSFLEETFSAPSASPIHRLHQKAARAVLKALLPEAGAGIRGHMRSYQELLSASGYQDRPRDFEELLRILDEEVRLLSPVDPEGSFYDSADSSHQAQGDRYYHLTHDYLVPSLREWITQKEKETARGRAKIRLAERSVAYSHRPIRRNLPAWWEWLVIMLFTSKRDRTETRHHRNMLRAATRYHALRGFIVLFLLGLMGWAAYEAIGLIQANRMVHVIGTASQPEVVELVEELEPLRRWADPLLVRMHKDSEDNPSRRLNFSLALLPSDPVQEPYLYERMLQSDPPEFTVIRNLLGDYGNVSALNQRLWDDYRDEEKDSGVRFRAVMALARLDNGAVSGRTDWEHATEFLADQMIKDAVENPSHYQAWVEGARPISSMLVEPLHAIFCETDRPDSELYLAATILADYAADDQAMLRKLLLAAQPQQYGVLLAKSQPTEAILKTLNAILDEPSPENGTEAQRDEVAKSKAHAATLLLQLDKSDGVWPLLKTNTDPRVRTYLLHRLAGVGTRPEVLLERIDYEEDPSIRAAIVLSLGGMADRHFSEPLRKEIVEKFAKLYHDAHPAVHSAAEWGLRRQGEGDRLEQMHEELRCQAMHDPHDFDRFQTRDWYVDRQGHTMVIIPGPVQSRIGSPPDEDGSDSDEQQVVRTINRSFSIAATEVTLQQFLRSELPFNHAVNDYSPDPSCPVNAVSWYDAAKYCRWLSQEHDIPNNQMCYPPISEIEPGMVPYPDYLSRTGYRLPTEAEWEYACRAGTATSRYYGSATEMLRHYAWYRDNANGRAWPVGMLKPNDRGLFDMIGNVAEWCGERYLRRGEEHGEDTEDTAVVDASQRTARGGKYRDAQRTIRSASRRGDQSHLLSFDKGFRVVRTLE